MPLLRTEDQVPDREAFVTFVRELHQDFIQRGEEWENPTLDHFLEALAAWAESSPGWYRNFHQELPTDGNWTFFARALMAATIYE